jgi:hypothetical protein
MAVSDSAEPSINEAQSAIVLFNVRLGPSFYSGIKYQIAGGTNVTIKCATDNVDGTWYQLTDGGFILASIVAVPPSIASCGDPDVPPGGVAAFVIDTPWRS